MKPGSVIVETTSGNTGVGLAFAYAPRDNRCILTMPDSFSIERRKLMKCFGAELALTPRAKGVGGAIEKAVRVATRGEMKGKTFVVIIPSCAEHCLSTGLFDD